MAGHFRRTDSYGCKICGMCTCRSQKDGKTYIGSTNDLRRRFKEHNDGLVIATSHRTPFILEAYVAVKTEEKARALEKYLKVGSGNAFLKKRIL